RAVGAHLRADHRGPERPHAAEHEPGPEGEQDHGGDDRDQHGGVPLGGAGRRQPGRVVAQRVGRTLDRLLTALADLAAGLHRRLAAGADARGPSGRPSHPICWERMVRQAGAGGGAVRVGTASWTDPTLLKSGWYPKGANDAESRLRFYATPLPIVEVDATSSPPPRPC